MEGEGRLDLSQNCADPGLGGSPQQGRRLWDLRSSFWVFGLFVFFLGGSRRPRQFGRAVASSVGLHCVWQALWGWRGSLMSLEGPGRSDCGLETSFGHSMPRLRPPSAVQGPAVEAAQHPGPRQPLAPGRPRVRLLCCRGDHRDGSQRGCRGGQRLHHVCGQRRLAFRPRAGKTRGQL